jgi:hypothetical protein
MTVQSRFLDAVVSNALKVGGTSAADSKSVLDLESTTKGLLPPRMTATQRDAISSPPTGLCIYNTDTNKLNVYNGTSWIDVGSGSGSGGINYISMNNGNSDFELNTTGWSAYADAAGSLPVDGTGGSPTVTITRSTSNPLRGTASGLITKDAANRQGEGVGYAFSIEDADKGKTLQISFDYEINSGTYADGDLTVYIYDVTNSAVIQPSGYSISNVGIESKQTAIFQTASNSTSYRLIFHVASTSASAWVVKIDTVSVGPQVTPLGAAMTDWASFTPTFTGVGTPSNVSFLWRRVGDSIQVQGTLTTGTNTSVKASMTLPNSLTLATQTIVNTTSNPGPQVGMYSNEITAQVGGVVTATGTSSSLVYFSNPWPGTQPTLTPANATSIWNSNSIVAIQFTVRIAGWSSNVVQSSDTSSNVIAMRSNSTPTSAAFNNTAYIIFPTVLYDKTGSYSTVTGLFTAPTPGVYTFSGQFILTGSNAPGFQDLNVYKNGFSTQQFNPSTLSTGELVVPFSVDFELVAGDTIGFRWNTDRSSPAVSGGTTKNTLNIKRLSGPAAIQVTDEIMFRGTNTAGTAITGSKATIPFVVSDDTAGGWNGTDTYTVKVPGKYEIYSRLESGNTNGGTFYAQKNGSDVSYSSNLVGGLSRYEIKDIIRCLANDTIRMQADSAGTNTLATNANRNILIIRRVGNY